MPRMDVTQMSFGKLYPLLVNKAVKKGRTRAEVDQVTAWLTGYTEADLARLEQIDITYGDFFRQAPAMNPSRLLITGKVCGIRVEEIQDPLMRDILTAFARLMGFGTSVSAPWAAEKGQRLPMH